MGVENNYVECLVPSKGSPVMIFLKYLLLIFAILFFIGAFLLGGGLVFMILCIAAGFGYHFAALNATIEYEYQYCEREISVDKVLNKSSRKHVGNYSVEHIEIMAPSRSYHLDEFKNRTFKVVDYSSKDKNAQPDPTYTIIYDGKEKIILEPTSEFVSAIKAVAPRKVYTE
ncbi:MAG: DUF6106 family protein [Butyrivibrio sp.]|nr:DUF6106 family protein [Butyrivibrio sp.]